MATLEIKRGLVRNKNIIHTNEWAWNDLGF